MTTVLVIATLVALAAAGALLLARRLGLGVPDGLVMIPGAVLSLSATFMGVDTLISAHATGRIKCPGRMCYYVANVVTEPFTYWRYYIFVAFGTIGLGLLSLVCLYSATTFLLSRRRGSQHGP